jgi:hypothetical protein
MRALAFSLATLLAAPAHAEPAARANLVYAEALGKGGPYGVGYERAITPRLALGAVASFAVLRDQQLATLAPYVHVRIAGRRNVLYGDVGLAIVHSRVPSPVAGWDGDSDTGAGGLAALGYERAGDRVVFRAYAAVMAGEGGVAPAIGLALGVRL